MLTANRFCIKMYQSIPKKYVIASAILYELGKNDIKA